MSLFHEDAVHVGEDDGRHARNLRVGQVARELLQHAHSALVRDKDGSNTVYISLIVSSDAVPNLL